MILSDFLMTHQAKGESLFDRVYFANVQVTTQTGSLWWRRRNVVRRDIARGLSGLWYFVDNGEFCPSYQAESLERSYKARKVLAGR